MFIPGGCFCCEPPEDPCVLSGCTWSSTDMSDADLTAEVAYKDGPDGEYEVSSDQDATNGNDPACRKIRIETVVPPEHPDVVYAVCWKDNATHNPSTQCPLTNVSFCVESKRHGDSNPGSELSDGVVFVVRQGGKIYATATQSVGVNWKRASGTYTAGQFNWIAGAGNPNFTATGTSIEFGFALRLNVGADEEPLDVVLFDNLCITRTITCGQVCDTSSCHFLSTGDTPATVESTAGGGSSSYSADASRGVPSPSHRVTFTSPHLSPEITLLVSSDVFSGLDDCRRIQSVLLCYNFLAEGSLSSIQQRHIFKLRQGSEESTLWDSGLVSYNSDTWLRQSTSKSGMRFDLSSPVELIVTIKAGSSITALNIDNICIVATISNCPYEWAVDFSGATITPPTKPGAIEDAAWAAAFSAGEDVLDKTVSYTASGFQFSCGASASGPVEFNGSWSGYAAGAPWGTTSGTWTARLYNSLSHFTATTHKTAALITFSLTSWTGTPPFASGWSYSPGFQGRTLVYDLVAWPCNTALAATSLQQSDGFVGSNGVVDVSGASILIYRS